MSEPVPIAGMNIAGYILIGNKRLTIRLTLDDLVQSSIDVDASGADQGVAQHPTDDDVQEELSDEPGSTVDL